MAFFDIPDVDAETDEGLCFVNFAAAFLDLLTSDDTDIEPYRRCDPACINRTTGEVLAALAGTTTPTSREAD